jgi:hypothetical protein
MGVLLSTSVAGQGPIAADRPVSVTSMPAAATLMRVVTYPDDLYLLPQDAPPACLRIGRCSAHDLYRFRDRPNRLARLAPEALPESQALLPSTQYLWFFAPITPEENILPKYRRASQVRDEYRAAGSTIDAPN